MPWTLAREAVLPAPRDAVFAFFADPANLEAITPPWLQFRLRPPLPERLEVGARIEYGLRIRGVPVRWTSMITEWDPPRKFVDVQARGPYRAWSHTHTFRDAPRGGTVVGDLVVYDHAGGMLVEQLLVRPDLDRIFRFRARELARRFGSAVP